MHLLIAVILANTDVAGYDQGFFIRSPDQPFELRTQARLQTRYTLELPDEGDNESDFAITRARLVFDGKAFSDGLTYKFQADFGKGFVTLKDFYLDYALVPKTLYVRAGQWKRPFSRQQITSSAKLELVDRALTDAAFGAGRDIGVALHNNYEKSPTLEWALGVYNGTGEKPWFEGKVADSTVTSGKFTNVPNLLNPAVVARLGYNHGDVKGYEEADFAGGDLRFGVGASGWIDFDADGDNDGQTRAELDYIAKAHGFATTGGLYSGWSQAGHRRFQVQDFAQWGLHLQASYLIGERFQPAVRYTRIASEDAKDVSTEALVGLSVYVFKHALKWQTEAGLLVDDSDGEEAKNTVIRSQLQMSF